jgi:hypothetical protein
LLLIKDVSLLCLSCFKLDDLLASLFDVSVDELEALLDIFLTHVFELANLFISRHQLFVKLGSKSLKFVLHVAHVLVILNLYTFEVVLQQVQVLFFPLGEAVLLLQAFVDVNAYFLAYFCNHVLQLLHVALCVQLLVDGVEIAELSFGVDYGHELLAN